MQRSLLCQGLDHFGLSEVAIGEVERRLLVEPLHLRVHRERLM